MRMNGQKLADKPDSIPTPTRCELCGSPRVEVAGVYQPGPARQAEIRPRPRGVIAYVYGLCRPCSRTPDCLALVQARLDEPAAVVMATAGRG
jgi:ribosomal protein S14